MEVGLLASEPAVYEASMSDEGRNMFDNIKYFSHRRHAAKPVGRQATNLASGSLSSGDRRHVMSTGVCRLSGRHVNVNQLNKNVYDPPPTLIISFSGHTPLLTPNYSFLL